MTRSIRKFLLINLLLGVVLMTVISTLSNLVLNEQEVQQQLDAELLQDNIALQAIIGTKNSDQQFAYLTIIFISYQNCCVNCVTLKIKTSRYIHLI